MPGIARCLIYHVAPCQILHPLWSPVVAFQVHDVDAARATMVARSRQ
jgi:hypothetical protein